MSTVQTFPVPPDVPDHLSTLQDTLLLQCAAAQVPDLLEITNRAGSGMVLTAERQRTDAIVTVAKDLLNRGMLRRPLLLDAARYAGANRLSGREGFDLRWIRQQQELGLPVLTDSGYIGQQDDEALATVLRQARAVDQSIATLPLHSSWLREQRQARLLAARVQDANVPVALVLEHTTNPFDLVGVAAGVIEVVGAGVPVMLLRTDVSGLGFICCGGLAAAIGTTTALRHLYPQSSGGPPRRSAPAALVKECLTYVQSGKIALTQQRHPDSTMWNCRCLTCDGRDLGWLATVEPQQRQEALAFAHSLDVLMQLRDVLLEPASPTSQRRRSWLARCSNAHHRHLEVKWDPPAFLTRWLHVLAPAEPRQDQPG